MKLINNVTETLKDDLSVEIHEGSKLSIAAACFSIYAFQELKKQLTSIDELRFIFTAPTFVTEKAKKEKREFYIPRLNRERNLYGTEFEIKLRNELTQKAIARECAEWIKKKAVFKSNKSNEDMFKNNPEEFISKVIRLINEQKATMIVEHISYDTIEGEYDSAIFTAEKNTQSFDKAFLAKKAIQDYVFTDGSAEKSIERKFAEDLDAAEEVCVYAKLPRTFQIPTPVGNYSPDWAIAFYEGTVKHIFFIAETKGTMESLELRPIEQAKISCAKKLFNEMSNSKVVYHDVDSYQSLLDIIEFI